MANGGTDERVGGPTGRLDVSKMLLRLSLVAVVVVVVIQFVPVERTNPPVEADFDGPPEVAALLKTSCYDCHSNETRWPWHSRVAPASWLVAHDVEEARGKMNFSLWGTYDPRRQEKLAEEIWEEVEGGEMPLRKYLVVHPDARLSESAKQTLREWSLEVAGHGQ
jgi:hypothetical protein